jgi:uncharacterized protein YcaQ
LRIHAVSQSLFEPATLKDALVRLGFVQADPIRAPARAQDLILRHRVKNYRAGDLERLYPALNVEEDFLYAYGYVSRTIWPLLHPRRAAGLSKLQKKVLETVRRFGEMHPRELEAHFGRDRIVNAWGGYSKATTHALEHLHYRGLLRIARRENGIRIYNAAPAQAESLPAAERLKKLALVTANIFAPSPEKSLVQTIRRFWDGGSIRPVLDELLRAGELERETIDGVAYVWPALERAPEEGPRRVRFLAPFDPLIWDRNRFEHLWGWAYRFEAYTPLAKRQRGYYAMPLLWGVSVIGWANASVSGGKLDVQVGFVEKTPRDRAFRSELEAEIERMAAFLGMRT